MSSDERQGVMFWGLLAVLLPALFVVGSWLFESLSPVDRFVVVSFCVFVLGLATFAAGLPE